MLDEKSFSDIMQQYFNQVARFAFTYLRDQQAAEDVAQEVFSRLWMQRNTLREMQSLRAYLFGAVRNRALDVLKHEGVRSSVSDLLWMEEESRYGPNNEHDIERADDIAFMLRALKELPERRRTALRLRYIEGFTVLEVGAAMEIAPKAAEQLLVQAVKALRREIL